MQINLTITTRTSHNSPGRTSWQDSLFRLESRNLLFLWSFLCPYLSAVSLTHICPFSSLVGYRICVGNLIINCMHASDRIRLCFSAESTNRYLFSFVSFYLLVCAGVVAVTQTRKWSDAFCFTPLSFLSYLAFIKPFFSSLCAHKARLYLDF